MPRQIETDESALKTYAESSNDFEPLPEGDYEFTIKAVEEVKYANEGPNARPALNVQLRIIEGSPVGAKRVVFLRVPLFQKFAATGKGKYPDGSPAFLHFQFYDVLGFDVKNGILPDDRDLLGKRIGGHIIQREWKGKVNNEVKYVRKPKGITPGAVAEIAGDVWASEPAVETSEDVWGTSSPSLQAAADSASGF